MTSSEKLAYTVAEAAAAMGVTTKTIHRRIASGALPSFKWFGRTLIRAADLRAVLGAGPSGSEPER